MQPFLFTRKLRCTCLVAFSFILVLAFLQLYSDDFQRLPLLKLGHDYDSPELSEAQDVIQSSTISQYPVYHSIIENGKYDQTISASPSPLVSSTSVVTEPGTMMPKTAAIVVAVSMEADLEWLSGIDNSVWKLHRYNYDDLQPPPHVWFPKNKGNEAMLYLSYIINNYESLPDYSMFIHGHRTSWHQEGDMVGLINDLRFSALEEAGYVPLRCDWYPSCPSEIRPLDHDAIVWGPGVHRDDAEREIAEAWHELFGPQEELPRTIASQCCAQFTVTRGAIRARGKADYERMRDWLLRTDLINDISGRVFEKLWAYIMTKEAVRCPPPQTCACEYFGQCVPKDWPIPPEGLPKWNDSTSTRR